MIRKIIFRRTAGLISSLIFSILIVMVVFSLIEQRRQIKNYVLSFGIVVAGEIERLIQWEDIYALNSSLERMLESDTFFRYIFLINEGELYAEACSCEALMSQELIQKVTDYPDKAFFLEFLNEQGHVFYEAVIPVPNTMAFLRMGMDRSIIDGQIIPYLLMIIGIGVFILVAGLFYSRNIARRSTIEIELLSGEIRNYRDSFNQGGGAAAGGELSTEQLVESFKTLVSERKQAMTQLEKSLHEKDVLLKEIYHRTGNNMQIISSLLFLQCDKCAEPDFIMLVDKLDCRIQVMAIAHQMMYDSNDLSSIDVKRYITDLSSFLFYKYSRYSANVSLHLELAEFKMLYDKAIPIGLILNELTSNSLIHAFPGNAAGEIRIQIRRDTRQHGKIIFIYSDSGKGIPEEIDYRNDDDSLGIRIITALAEDQLRGVLNIQNADGYLCSLEFNA